MIAALLKEQAFKTVTCLLVAILLCHSTANAVIVIKDGKRIRGYLRSEDRSRIVVDVVEPNGQITTQIFDASQVKVRKYIDRDRLAALREDNPRDYRDYADLLLEKKEDPDARDTALRLYLIAAHLDPEGEGRSSLVFMAELALSPDEERTYLAMAYLLDPKHDTTVLKTNQVSISGVSLEDAERNELRRGLRAFWSGRMLDARKVVEDKVFQELLDRFSTALTVRELREGVSGLRLPSATFRKVILLEQALSEAGSVIVTDTSEEGRAKSWAALDWRRPAASTAALSLETITPFDPRKTRYVNGEWVRPGDLSQ